MPRLFAKASDYSVIVDETALLKKFELSAIFCAALITVFSIYILTILSIKAEGTPSQFHVFVKYISLIGCAAGVGSALDGMRLIINILHEFAKLTPSDTRATNRKALLAQIANRVNVSIYLCGLSAVGLLFCIATV